MKKAADEAPKRRTLEFVQKCLVVCNYPRKEVQVVVPLTDSDILIDGLNCFAGDDDEMTYVRSSSMLFEKRCARDTAFRELSDKIFCMFEFQTRKYKSLVLEEAGS